MAVMRFSLHISNVSHLRTVAAPISVLATSMCTLACMLHCCVTDYVLACAPYRAGEGLAIECCVDKFGCGCSQPLTWHEPSEDEVWRACKAAGRRGSTAGWGKRGTRQQAAVLRSGMGGRGRGCLRATFAVYGVHLVYAFSCC